MRTPLIRLPGADDVLLKLELLQPTGSFKLRGVWNWAAALLPAERGRGFATFSAGNTALALGFAARRFGVTCTSMLPDYAPANKVQALEAAGVETTLVPFDEMARYIFSAGWRGERRAFLHPWTGPAMIAGHATIALELLEEMPSLDTVFIPVGGGALCAGVGSVLRRLAPRVRVVAVQSASYPALTASLRAGRPVWIDHGTTICDGVAVPFMTEEMFPLLSRVVDDAVTVTDRAVRGAIRRLLVSTGLAVEGAGALAVAAALSLPPAKRGRCVCLVTGGNVEPALLEEISRRTAGTPP